MPETFSHETKRQIIEAQNHMCAYPGCGEPIHSIHHKLRNERPNRNSFPLFIHSPMNGVGLCDTHHTQNAYEFMITPNMAMVYEQYLTGLCEKKGDI